MKDRCKFVVLSDSRSGSTFFRLYLNSHPQIRCHGEIFLKTYGAKDGFPNWCRTSFFWTRIAYSLRFYRPLIYKFFHELFNNESFSAPWTNMETWNEYQPRVNVEHEKAVGFKLMYGHMEPKSLRYKKVPSPLKQIIKQVKCIPFLTRYVKEENFRIVHFIRENPLKIEVSRITAAKTKMYHTVEKRKHSRVFVDPATIKSKLQNILDNQDTYRRVFSNNPYLEMSYERFLTHKSEMTSKVLDFLQVDDVCGLASSLKKINPDRLEDIISNYDEIKEILSNTPFEKYLYYP